MSRCFTLNKTQMALTTSCCGRVSPAWPSRDTAHVTQLPSRCVMMHSQMRIGTGKVRCEKSCINYFCFHESGMLYSKGVGLRGL